MYGLNGSQNIGWSAPVPWLNKTPAPSDPPRKRTTGRRTCHEVLSRSPVRRRSSNFVRMGLDLQSVVPGELVAHETLPRLPLVDLEERLSGSRARACPCGARRANARSRHVAAGRMILGRYFARAEMVCASQMRRRDRDAGRDPEICGIVGKWRDSRGWSVTSDGSVPPNRRAFDVFSSPLRTMNHSLSSFVRCLSFHSSLRSPR